MSTSPQRNEQLDGLRGYAALMVVFFHAILGADPDLVGRVLYRNFSGITGARDWMSKIGLTLLNGETAVALFFIMSGAVLFESLMRDRSPTPSLIRNFFIRRFFRIYPVLFVCLIACWLVFNAAGTPRTADNLLLNLSLLEYPVNGATWTLGVEAWGAVLLALGFLAFKRFKEAGLVVVALIFACLYLPPLMGYLVQFRMFIYCFALGALIPTPLGRAVISRIPTWSWPILLIGTIFARHTIQETIAVFLVGLIYYRKAGALGDFLARPTSVFLGTISYSLYLWNVLFLEIINLQLHRVSGLPHPLVTGLISGLVITAFAVPVACLSVKYIELPFIGVGRLLTSRKKESLTTFSTQQSGA
ncbi:acyltransferase [Bradyrhizobium sp. NFR13]|uniref:acyltransferase family protein n=1 Tax=Bradyrhizobium sp. NFR13 TaxID=1566285 RepID=UPI000B84E573|nr:acyltransferase [Bradyrhizobium sp. NFR13]